MDLQHTAKTRPQKTTAGCKPLGGALLLVRGVGKD